MPAPATWGERSGSAVSPTGDSQRADAGSRDGEFLAIAQCRGELLCWISGRALRSCSKERSRCAASDSPPRPPVASVPMDSSDGGGSAVRGLCSWELVQCIRPMPLSHCRSGGAGIGSMRRCWRNPMVLLLAGRRWSSACRLWDGARSMAPDTLSLPRAACRPEWSPDGCSWC